MSAVLSSAADIIERDGWAQHVMVDRDGSCCTEAALSLATSAYPLVALRVPARAALLSVLPERDLNVSAAQEVADWNDSPDRTAAEVIAALRKAAEVAR